MIAISQALAELKKTSFPPDSRTPRRAQRFAFILHPLTVDYLARHPRYAWTRYLPRTWIEVSAAHMPAQYVGTVKGGRSPATDKPVEGLIYAIGATPRQMLTRPPEFTYTQLNAAVADAARFRARGFEFWSEPVRYDLGASAGSPVEVIFEGPDTVAINLVELATTDPATRIGQMRAYVEQHGRTRTGFTPVVTTSHVARSIPKARDFYERVLGMGVLIDEVIHADGSNRFLRLEPGSRTHVVFMQGNHMFERLPGPADR